MLYNIDIYGSSGELGGAFVKALSEAHPAAQIHAFSRRLASHLPANVKNYQIIYDDEASIAEAAAIASQTMKLDLVIVATGILHDGAITPEKSLRDLSAEKFHHILTANLITPALIGKYFLPKLARDKRAIFAALSARVGSISDNNLGGWYAYRASKAALNMFIKNAAIELGRRYQQAINIGLHTGTVDSNLSKPYQSHVPSEKLFSPAFSAVLAL